MAGGKDSKQARAAKKAAQAAPAKDLVTREGAGPNAMVTITPRGCALVARSFAEGLKYVTVAERLGISGRTLQSCRKRQESVDEAWEAGNAALEDELTHHLLRAARKGNVVAAIYLTKAKFGWREGDSPEARAHIVINLPDSATPEAYMRLVGETKAAGSPNTAPAPASLPGPKGVGR